MQSAKNTQKFSFNKEEIAGGPECSCIDSRRSRKCLVRGSEADPVEKLLPRQPGQLGALIKGKIQVQQLGHVLVESGLQGPEVVDMGDQRGQVVDALLLPAGPIFSLPLH